MDTVTSCGRFFSAVTLSDSRSAVMRWERVQKILLVLGIRVIKKSRGMRFQKPNILSFVIRPNRNSKYCTVNIALWFRCSKFATRSRMVVYVYN